MFKLTNAGRDYLLNAGLTGGAQFSTFYVGIYETNVDYDADETMTTLMAAVTESVSYATTANARKIITPDALSDGIWGNAGTPTVFTFSAAKTIYGAFITTGSTRGATAGILLATGLFSSPKVQGIGDTLTIPVALNLIPV